MAFGATITITVDSVAMILNRINQDNYGSEYSLITDNDSWNLKIRHSTDSPDSDGMTMVRHNVYLEHITYPTATTLQKKETVTTTYRVGYQSGVTDVTNVAEGFTAWLAATSYAVIGDLVLGLN